MLLAHAFLKRYETEDVNVAAWFAQAMNHCEVSTPATVTPTNFLTRRSDPIRLPSFVTSIIAKIQDYLKKIKSFR